MTASYCTPEMMPQVMRQEFETVLFHNIYYQGSLVIVT